MVEVVSQFKVEEGWEAVVRQAFRERPRLVDHAAGFLGMEVFTDAADPAVFRLVTRWTDLASYEAWHGSAAHRLSHKLIPKGLKLVPGSTQVTYLERLPAGGGPATAEQVAADAAPVLACHLIASRTVHLLVAARDGAVRWANAALAAALGVPEQELPGRPVWGLLTEADAALLRDRVSRSDRNYEESFLLNFVDAACSPFTLECRCDVQPDHFLVMGEPPREKADAFQVEWLRMNNELAVLTRENARQNKELQEAKRGLEQTLADLRDSHWLLKKLQEVLPICMDCGKVKVGSEWQNVVQYLQKNALFLSHGYCPACLARVAAEWGLPPKAIQS